MLVPVVFQSFYCDSSTTLSDGQQTLLKLSADSWEELNAVTQNRNQNRNVGALHDSKLQNFGYFVVLLQFAEYILLRF